MPRPLAAPTMYLDQSVACSSIDAQRVIIINFISGTFTISSYIGGRSGKLDESVQLGRKGECATPSRMKLTLALRNSLEVRHINGSTRSIKAFNN